MRLCCLILLIPPLASAQDEELTPKAFRLAGILTVGVEKELKLLGDIAGLDDDSRNEIRRGLVAAIRDTAVKIVNQAKPDKRFRILQFAQVPAQLQAAVASAVCKLAADENIAAKVREDVRLRVSLHKRNTVDGFVALVDHIALLSSEQVLKVRVLGEQLSEKGELPNCHELVRYGVPGKAVAKQLESLLDARQFSAWKNLPHGLGTEDGLVIDSTLPAEVRRKQLGEALSDMGDIYIQWYGGELDLTPKQIRRIKLAKKGVITHAIGELMEQQERDIAGDQKRWQPIGLETDFSQPFTTERWHEFVRGALTQEQGAMLDEFRDRRGRCFGRLMASYLLVGMSSGQQSPGQPQLFMNGKQQAATHDLLSKGIGSIGTVGKISPVYFFKLLEVPEEDFAKAMGDENWKRFQPVIKQLRDAKKAGTR